MRAVVLTSNGLRHAYFAQSLASFFDLLAVIKEDKGDYYSKVREASPFIQTHFENLKETEKLFFGAAQWPAVPTQELAKGEINNAKRITWVADLSPDLIFLFGTGILSDDWLARFPDRIVNLHLGLSPYYRGSATLFWPVVNGELECVGATIHLVERQVDSGRLLARVKPKIEVGDSYYTINFKTIKQAIDSLPDVVRRYTDGDIIPSVQNLEMGVVYRKGNFNEEALRIALDLLSKGVTIEQLDAIGRSNKCGCSL